MVQLFRMGLLPDIGPILEFEAMKALQKTLKVKGMRQFLHRYKHYSAWKKPQGLAMIKWGQQIEGHFLRMNQKGQLQLFKGDLTEEYSDTPFQVVFEYGSWMFEMVPQQPHTTTCNFYDIIQSTRQKYQVLKKKSRIHLTIPVIPFIGLRDPLRQTKFNNTITQSIYIDDNHIANHPRFRSFTKNIRMRRESNVEILVPIQYEQQTKQEELDKTQPKKGFIHMDAMAFGMGCCCLQCTFSTKNLDHARYVYDQLNVLSPIFMALTAGSPFFKGKVSAWDARWNIVADSVDDRTPSERDPHSSDYLPVSRYSYARYYIWDSPMNKKSYSDQYTGVKEQDIAFVSNLAKESKVELDEKLLFHLAYIFRRDYIMAYEKFPQLPDDQFTVFDMLNGTNWNSVRLKIPIDDDIGWRVEFRTMEIQLTADENSAYSLIIHLIARILHQSHQINLYIPISKLGQNFNRAHQKDAVRTQKFFFRTNIYGNQEPVIEELTVFEILFGKGDFKGILHQVESRIESCVKMCPHVEELVSRLKKFLHQRASGQRPTLARWMREYAKNHPDYTNNSILSKKVMDDMLMRLYRIECGEIEDPTFASIFPHGEFKGKKQLAKCFVKEEGM